MAKITIKPLDKNDPLFKKGFITYKKKSAKIIKKAKNSPPQPPYQAQLGLICRNVASKMVGPLCTSSDFW